MHKKLWLTVCFLICFSQGIGCKGSWLLTSTQMHNLLKMQNGKYFICCFHPKLPKHACTPAWPSIHPSFIFYLSVCLSVFLSFWEGGGGNQPPGFTNQKWPWNGDNKPEFLPGGGPMVRVTEYPDSLMRLTMSSWCMWVMSVPLTARIRSPTWRRPHRSAGLFSKIRPTTTRHAAVSLQCKYKVCLLGLHRASSRHAAISLQ